MGVLRIGLGMRGAYASSFCKGSGKPGIDETGRNGETATAAAGTEAVVAVITTPPSRCAVEPAIGSYVRVCVDCLDSYLAKTILDPDKIICKFSSSF